MLRKLENLGARCESRVLERNTLYDTPDSDFRRRGALLRIRAETARPLAGAQTPSPGRRSTARRTILTSKAPAAPRSPRDRRYKEKRERELVVPALPLTGTANSDPSGFVLAFATTKFRSTFRLSRLPGLAIELDETPAGTFLELEGLPRAIDRAARALGYSSRDYYCGSYWDVHVADCRHRGITPRNMVFDKQK